MNAQQTMTEATDHLRAGRLVEAELLYRAIIAQSPNHADALHLLGCTLSKAHRANEAIDLIQRATTIDSMQAPYYFNLAMALLAAGRKTEAVSALANTLLLDPNADNARLQLGNALSDIGHFDQAEECFNYLLQRTPKVAGLHYNLGNCYFRKGSSFRPGDDPSQIDQAARRQLLDKAVTCFEKTIALDPRFAPAQNNLAMALWITNRQEEAIAVWRRAANEINDLPSWYNLGRALCEKDQLDEAIDAMSRCLQMDPSQPDTHNNLGNAYRQRGQIEQAITQFEQTIAFQPQNKVAHSNRLYTLYYHPTASAQSILAAHKSWNENMARPLSAGIAQLTNDRDPARKLKIGYVSPNFWAHCQALFTIPLLGNHDHQSFEIYCYSDTQNLDETTDKIRQFADVWRSLVGVTDDQAAELIRRDKIDILVDLTVHMAENRMLLFARKPAPIQITWLGYPGTTGLETIDYRFTDPYLDPPGEFDADYAEKSYRLPHTFWCLDRDALQAPDIPTPNALPAAQAGYITFGALNNFCKVNQSLLDLWKRVLDSVPTSRFLLLAPTGRSRDWVRRTLDDHKLGERVDFVPRSDRIGYLHYYHRIDIGLDTLPYNGHTTTLDSLWMGVPVVTLVGNTVVGRAGFSQLSNLDLLDLVATTPDEFVRIATELAGDLPRLKDLRLTLRDRMLSSSLLDGTVFARGVESAYRQMWRRYCGVAE
jgi:predicted O-linked N-acetylglucosamine transferase (SPINDLY family)